MFPFGSQSKKKMIESFDTMFIQWRTVMKKYLFIIYLFILIFVTSITMYIALFDVTHNTRKYPAENSIEYWTEYETVYSDNSTSFIGTIEPNPGVGNVLAFFSTHQIVEVYNNDELIYKYPVVQSNPLSASPGYSWNVVSLDSNTCNLKITISSPYFQYIKKEPSFIIGNFLSISSRIINDSIISFTVCIIIFFLGIGMISYWLCIRKTVKIQANIFYLGVFAVLLSIWSINETPLVTLIMHNNIVNMYMAFTTLMLLPLPFSFFVRSFYNEDGKLWDIFALINIIQVITCLALQLFKICDYRNTLWTTHAIFALLAALILYSSIKILIKGVQSKKIIIHLCCITLCALCLAGDLFDYYQNSWDNNALGRFSFLFYFIVLGYSSTRESSELIKRGKKAAIYRQLAYTDLMTDMLNRTAFSKDFEEIEKRPENTSIIAFDLNNLKITNDNYGHSVGDEYITDSANIIKSVFAKYGKCYRIGGDEFISIIPEISEHNLQRLINLLEHEIEIYNEINHSYILDIAHGYATYNAELDNTFEDTYKRADKEMYENKKLKKEL